MKTYQCKLTSVSPYTSSKPYASVKTDTESHDAFDERAWPEKLHTLDGMAIIPPMAFKFALSAAAKYVGKKIAGKGNRTWAKLFEAGIMIVEPVELGIPVKDVKSIRVFVNADGVRGSGKRVMRSFPIVPKWSGTLRVTVLDETITDDILLEHLEAVGKFVGVGQYRAEKGGMNGRFAVSEFKEVAA